MSWGLEAQLKEQRAEIAALRDEIRRLSALLLESPRKVWVVVEEDYGDWNAYSTYVASSEAHAKAWVRDRKSNGRSTRGRTWRVEEWTVDGDEV